MQWPWRREVRSTSSYTDIVLDALLAAAEGRASASPYAVSAVEGCAGVYARAFAMATVAPSVIPPSVLYDVGRDLALNGEYVALLEVGPDGPMFAKPSSHVVTGGHSPASWRYDLWLSGPSNTSRVRVGRDRVIHVIINADSSTPWSGRSPISAARQTGRLLAELEVSLADEGQTPVGRMVPAPEGKTNLGTLQKRLNALAGKLALVETTSGGFGDKGAAPQQDWEPRRIGPAYTAAEVSLRELIEKSVCSIFGIHPVLMGANSDGGAMRESWRRFSRGTLEGLGLIVSAEFSRVLGADVSLDFSRLRASDTAGQARAFRALAGRETNVDVERALVMAGFDAPGTPKDPVPNDE